MKEHKQTEAHMVKHGKMEQLQKTTGRSFQEGRHRMQSQKRTRATTNREIMKWLVDIALHLAQQDGAFKGHDESSTSSNKGDFLELVQLIAKYDSTIKMHLDNFNLIQSQQKKTQTSLLSHMTQNDIINALATYVRRVILKEM